MGAYIFMWLGLCLPLFMVLVGCGGDSTKETADDGSIRYPEGDAGADGSRARDAEQPVRDADQDATSTAPWQPLEPQIEQVKLGATRTVFESPGSEPGDVLAAFARSHTFPAQSSGEPSRLRVSFSQNEDTVGVETRNGAYESVDNGISFQPLDPMPGLINVLTRASGETISLDFVPLGSQENKAQVGFHRLAEDGVTWSTETAHYEAPERIVGLRFHRGIVEVPSGPEKGTLLLALYTTHPSDQHGVNEQGNPIYYRHAAVAASVDGGATWTYRAPIAKSTPDSEFNEATIAFTEDGSLLAVVRHEDKKNRTLGNLMWARSLDKGHTFSAPKPVEVSLDGGEPTARVGVDPYLFRLGGAGLGLVSGRPDNWLAFSADGTGTDWTFGNITYVNRPSIPSNASQFHGSSGYQSVAAFSAAGFLLFGDNCANSWGCPASESGWTVDGQYRVWSREVQPQDDSRGRLGVATGLRNGELTVVSDGLEPRIARLGTGLLFDGQVAPWSALVASGRSGSIELRFDRAIPITRLAVALGTQPGSSARAYFLVDGDGEPPRWFGPVAKFDAGQVEKLQTVAPESPVLADGVRIMIEGSSDCSVHCAELDELEIHTSGFTFEDDVLGAAPSGWQGADGVEVFQLSDGNRVLRITDRRSDSHPIATLPTDQRVAASLSFRVDLSGLEHAWLFGIRDADSEQSAYHFGVFPNGELRQYDHETSGWVGLSGAPIVDRTGWNRVRVEASQNQALVYINDEEVAAAAPSIASVAGLKSPYFSSAGTAPSGDQIDLDDVVFE